MNITEKAQQDVVSIVKNATEAHKDTKMEWTSYASNSEVQVQDGKAIAIITVRFATLFTDK